MPDGPLDCRLFTFILILPGILGVFKRMGRFPEKEYCYDTAIMYSTHTFVVLAPIFEISTHPIQHFLVRDLFFCLIIRSLLDIEVQTKVTFSVIFFCKKIPLSHCEGLCG